MKDGEYSQSPIISITFSVISSSREDAEAVEQAGCRAGLPQRPLHNQVGVQTVFFE